MAFIPAQGAARLFLGFTINGVSGKGYVLHFRYGGAGAPSFGALTDLINDVTGAWLLELADTTGQGVVFNYATVRSLQSETAPYTEVSFPGGIAGVLAGSGTMPGSVCIAVHKQTANGGRSGMGRVYHTGLVEADVNGNMLLQPRADAILAVWSGLIDAVSGNDWFPAIVSYQTDNEPRTEGYVQQIANWTLRDLRVDTQRRRLR